MKFKAIIRNAKGEEIENQIRSFAYQLISETLITAGKSTGINPLKKYDEEMPFHDFFASCVHNLLLEVSLKLSEPEPTMMALIEQQIQSIGRADHSGKASDASAIEKFFNMITTHIGATHNDITKALAQLIQEQGKNLDNEPYLSQCLDLVKQFNLPEIGHIEFFLETDVSPKRPERRSTFSLYTPPTETPLEVLCKRYQVPAGDAQKLLRVIASTANTKDLKHLSSLVSITTIVNDQSPTGKTALHWLVKKAQEAADEKLQEKYRETYSWLIEHGANATLLDSDGKTALEYDSHELFRTLTADMTPK